jgi:hypothetical protein
MRPPYFHEIGSTTARTCVASQLVLTRYKLLEIERPSLHLGPRFGRERGGKINCENSEAESWPGIGVVAGFADVGGMMESSHMKMAALVS